jgi:hypothetical protein
MFKYSSCLVVRQSLNSPWTVYERFTNIDPSDTFAVLSRKVAVAETLAEISGPGDDRFTLTYGLAMGSEDGQPFSHGVQKAGTWLPPASMLASATVL